MPAAPAPAAPDPAAPAPALPAPGAPATPAAPAVPLLHPPLQVEVPSLGIAAEVVPVVSPEPGGTLVPPEQPGTAGWWAEGAWPSLPNGTVVLVGHVDTASGDLGVFGPLAEAADGSPVTVTTSDGAVQHYAVRARETHPAETLPPELFERSGPPQLALVTCTPPFDERRDRYANTLVVWADPVAAPAP